MVIPTLAFDVQDLVSLVVFLIIVVGGSIANALQKAAEKRQARRQAEESAPLVSPSTGKRTHLDEKLERRRRQLEELRARRRGETVAGSTPPASTQSEPTSRPEPGNLTIAEQAARERARRQYEERAARLRAQRAREAAEREAALQRARAEAERARQTRPTPAEPRRQVRPEAMPRRDRVVPARQQTVERQAQRPQVAQAVAPLTEPSAPVALGALHRPAAADAYDRRKPHIEGVKLDRQALRQAIIMNEVLGPPVALRGMEDRW